jgi:uncharacterized membrane protein (UPF0182 family)
LDSFEKEWQRWFPEAKNEGVVKKHRMGCAGRILIALSVVLVLFILVNISKSIYTEILWFSSLGYEPVYLTILGTKLALFFCTALFFFIFIFGNTSLAMRLSPKLSEGSLPWNIARISEKASSLSIIIIAAVISIIFGIIAQSNWQVVLEFFNGQFFSIADPVFNRDVSFYVFTLPFFTHIRNWLLAAFIITLIAVLLIYLLGSVFQKSKFSFSKPVITHVGVLGMALLGLIAWSYWLGIWELLFSTRGVVFGAGYADIHAKLPAQWILFGIVIVCIVIFIVSIVLRNYRLPLYCIGGWIVAAIIVGGIYPSIIQRFQVQPGELALEKPYIEYNIQFTRDAYNLEKIEEKPFPAEDMPSAEDIEQNQITINNIRLWDPRPLKDTYNQIQSIRLYYDFFDVDIDRYTIDDEYRQVMLSARELSAEKLSGEAQTWVNQRLQFTHGYGVALSPVNEITTQGLPVLLLKDIPPVGSFEIENPQIYFGEKTNYYIIVKTNTQEFDYPMGDENVYGTYLGKDGVALNSFLRRLVYAWQFGDINILISNELTPSSKIMYHRNIKERVSHLAPFLKYDEDPYIVIIDGKLYWILDAYTTTERYPYSEPTTNGLNYIRNSVKVVVNAYDGNATFYVTEPEDALIRTYQRIFPGLFVSAEQMPENIREHIRYPEGMFNIQAKKYQAYHMRDARVFYNKEDLWTFPKEFYAGSEQTMESYYVTMRLPEEDKEEFLLMLPFTPVNKNNTIGWLAARCDGENYGKLLAYFFPKERVVYGPSQIENRIQQDTVITEQLALWSRGGSRVIRGNLLFIPLAKSKLYVEPVFLQAEAGGLPELKRVIVAAGEQIAMEPTLDESIAAIYGIETEPAEPPPEQPAVSPEQPVVTEPSEPLTEDVATLVNEAKQHYEQAQQYLQEGDWTGYGEELEALKAILDKLAELTVE